MIKQQGYTLLCTRDITKKDIAKEYNQYFDTKYVFEPEAVVEGGIVSKIPYKSMRLYGGQWPLVPKNVMEKWQNEFDICFTKETLIRTYLKSNLFGWHQSELDLFLKCFNAFGIVLKCENPKIIADKNIAPVYQYHIYKIFMVNQIFNKMKFEMDIDIAFIIKNLYYTLSYDDYIDAYVKNIHNILGVFRNNEKAQAARLKYHMILINATHSYILYKNNILNKYTITWQKEQVIKMIENEYLRFKYPNYYDYNKSLIIKPL